ncbi:MAG TPA: OB-fold domain-containing protein, partial [Saprospiraceae bacterium]|nr:OB-fold domain-containing protein [Saprospiraceae bacterium]
MIAYIKGIVTECAPTHVVVEAGGVGYQVFISLNTFSQINGLKELKILTYAHYKEDGQSLYGFFKDD